MCEMGKDIMKRYEFKAGNARSDMIMGLSFPAVFGFPILGVQLALFYTGLDKFVKSHPLLLILGMFLALFSSYQLMKKIQKCLIKHYVVELDEAYIKIWESEEVILAGDVEFCKIKTHQSIVTSSLRVDIRTDVYSISFRSRENEYKSITGSSEWNLFGTGTRADKDTLLSLGRQIKCAIKEQGDEKHGSS